MGLLKAARTVFFSSGDQPVRRAALLNELASGLRELYNAFLSIVGEASYVPLPSSTVVAETAPGQTSTAGATNTFARGDHTHGTPGKVGTVTLDFGATPAEEANVVIAGQTWVTAASRIRAFFMQESTGQNGTDEHAEAAALCPLVIGSLVVGTGFTIFAHPLAAQGLGQFTVRWEAFP